MWHFHSLWVIDGMNFKLSLSIHAIQDPTDGGAHAVSDVDGPLEGLRDALAHAHLRRETRVGEVQPQPRLPRRIHAGTIQVDAVIIG